MAYNQEKIYFSITADFILAKSLLLVSFLCRKCKILAKSHNSLRLHKPIGISLTYSVRILCGVTFAANQKLVYVTCVFLINGTISEI